MFSLENNYVVEQTYLYFLITITVIYYYMGIEIYVWYNGEIKFLSQSRTIFFTREMRRMSVLIGDTMFFTIVKIYRMSVLIGWPSLASACSQASVNMESDFANWLGREI